MEYLTFIIYSHSECFDILEIAINKLKENNINDFIIFADCKYKDFPTIIYNDNLTYPQKLEMCLNNIKTKYIFFFHDNDILVKINLQILNELINKIESLFIDRLYFGVFKNTINSVIIDNKLSIVNINNVNSRSFITPYDVGPSIWKTEVLIKIMNLFSNYSYREIENSPIREYCRNNLNIWGIADNNLIKIKFCIGRPFSEYFEFLHVLCRQKFLEFHLYMDQEENLKNILIKNNYDINKRGILYNQNHIEYNNRSI